MALNEYPSKLLLFGEYTILNGSQALAVPLSRWKGQWILNQEMPPLKNKAFDSYVEWLQAAELISPPIAARILEDQKEGWTYQSDIPVGYGLGSSGALVAAIYDRYLATNPNISQELSVIILSEMESYFHGKSSGMDPMVSWMKKGIYKDETGSFQCMEDPGWPEEYKVFLLDSGIARATGPLVQTYQEKLKQEHFRSGIERTLIPMTEHAIHFYLSGTKEMLEACLEAISRFQRDFFSDFIPDDVQKQWDELMKKPGVYVKFCGAGGGGHFLVVDTHSALDSSMPNLIELT